MDAGGDNYMDTCLTCSCCQGVSLFRNSIALLTTVACAFEHPSVIFIVKHQFYISFKKGRGAVKDS